MTRETPVHATPQGVRLDLRVIPRSPRTGVHGVRDGRLLLRITAAPVDNAANDAVIALVARTFDRPKRSVRLVAGSTSRNKTVEVDGVSVEDVMASLGQGEPER